MGETLFLGNSDYVKISEKYLKEALKSGSIFEINTGAIARGVRTTAYPFENLLHIIKKHDASIILSSDSHSIDTLTFAFDDTRKYLKDIGFKHLKVLHNCEFKDIDI